MSTLRDWQVLADGIRVGGPMPITFSVMNDPALDAVLLQATMDTRCITSGYPTKLYNVTRFYSGPVREDMFFHAARLMYEHELAEWYCVDGKRIRDPHAPVTMLGEIP